VSNSYTATPGIVAGALTVNGPITSLSDAGITIGAGAPFVRLFKSTIPSLDLTWNLGTDRNTRDNAGQIATEILADNSANALRGTQRNAAGTLLNFQFDQTIAQDGTPVTNTGNVTENTIYSKLIPANTLGPHGALIIEFQFIGNVQGATGTTWRLKLGGTTVISEVRVATVNSMWRVVVQQSNATGAQRWNQNEITSASVASAFTTTSAIDMTGDQTLALTIQSGATTDSWTVGGWKVHAVVGRAAAL